MKGTFFVKPLEYKLDVEGETWQQGSLIKGSLEIVNHTETQADYSQLGCHLCFGNTKKIKAKNATALSLIESGPILNNLNQIQFCFKLPIDSSISDNLNSYYLICGNIQTPFAGGLLEISITPIETILSFVKIFEQFFRFKLKSYKNKQGYIEAIFKAPDTKEWSSIQKMSLLMKMDQDILNIIYIFKLKKMSFEHSIISTKDETLEINCGLSKKEYQMYGTVNQDGISKSISSILDQVKVKSFR